MLRHISLISLAAGLFMVGCRCSDDPPPAMTGISVADAAARACDVLLESAAPLGIEFTEDVNGRVAARNGRWALSFAAKADASLGTVARHTSAAQPRLLQQACYDRNGRRLASSPVRVD